MLASTHLKYKADVIGCFLIVEQLHNITMVQFLGVVTNHVTASTLTLKILTSDFKSRLLFSLFLRRALGMRLMATT